VDEEDSHVAVRGGDWPRARSSDQLSALFASRDRNHKLDVADRLCRDHEHPGPAERAAHPQLGTNGTAPEPLNATQYDRPLLALYGMISDVVANYNLDRNGNVLAQGAPVKTKLWPGLVRILWAGHLAHQPNLTLTYGLRWSLFPPPWETNGLQTASTFAWERNLLRT